VPRCCCFHAVDTLDNLELVDKLCYWGDMLDKRWWCCGSVKNHSEVLLEQIQRACSNFDYDRGLLEDWAKNLQGLCSECFWCTAVRPGQ